MASKLLCSITVHLQPPKQFRISKWPPLSLLDVFAHHIVNRCVITYHLHFHGLPCLTGSLPLRLCPIAKQHCLWSLMARVHWDTTRIQPEPLTVATITSQDLSLVSVPGWLPLLGKSQLSQRVGQSTRFRPLRFWPGLAVGPWANAWSSRKDSVNPRCRH